MADQSSNTPKCPRCGTVVKSDAPDGLCPRCLLALNLGTETELPGAELGPGGTLVVKPSHPPPPSPEALASHFPQFEIVELLGRGGMGAVYKARQPQLDRFVALKILLRRREDDGHPDTSFAERFGREARALARLNHPNIVAVYDYGEAGGYPFLVMEYVEGMTLRQLLRQGKVAPEEALAIVPHICEALQFAHQKGIVHRDIKPENILLDKAGQVKITDFGIAKIIVPGPADHSLTGAKDVMGTPHYMAPEQVEQPQKVDHRADIYSLGVVFYEMLTGELPLGKFQPPSNKVSVDMRLDEVVLRALAKEPERRYQQVEDVKTDLEHLASTPSNPSPLNAPGNPGSRDPLAVASENPRRPRPGLPYLGLAVLLAGAYWTYLWRFDPVEGRWMRPAGVLVAIIGAFLLLRGLLRPNHPPSDTGTAPRSKPKPGLIPATIIPFKGLLAGAALALVVGVGLLVWWETPVPFDQPTTSDSPDRKYRMAASTWLKRRVLYDHLLTYRFEVSRIGGDVFDKWEIPVPQASARIRPLASYTVATHRRFSAYSFEKHGRFSWSEDKKRVTCLVHDKPFSGFNTEDWSRSFQPGFLPVHRLTLQGTGLPDFFLNLETVRPLNVPTELGEVLRTAAWPTDDSLSNAPLSAWIRTNGLDLVKPTKQPSLLLLDGLIYHVDEKSKPDSEFWKFDNFPAMQVMLALENAERARARVAPEKLVVHRLNSCGVYAFKTREGSAGLIEVYEEDQRSGLTRFRYKFLASTNSPPNVSTDSKVLGADQKIPSGPAVGQAEATNNLPAGALAFSLGPALERVVSQSEADAKGFVFFSLQSGQSLKPPFALSRSAFGSTWNRLEPELQQWIRTNELDVLLQFQEKGWTLRCLELDEQPLGAPDYWERVTADEVAAAFNRGYSTYGQMLRGGRYSTAAGARERLTPCSAFRNRRKAMGVWQTAGMSTPPRGVKIRYRLLETNSTKPDVTPIPSPAGSTNSVSSTHAVDIRDVPLGDAIKALAKQVKLNYLFDPKINASQRGPDGRPLLETVVTVHWEKINAEEALAALLKNYHLQIIKNPQSPIARITTQDDTGPSR